MERPFELTSVTEPEDVPTLLLNGWRPRVYRLQTGELRLMRRYLELAPGLSIQEVRLLKGALRVNGLFDPGLLKIGFVRTNEIRISGNYVSNEIMAVAYGGSRLSFSANSQGSALSLHFSPEMARRVVPQFSLPLLMRRLEAPLGLETFLLPVTHTGRALHDLVARLLAEAEEAPDVISARFHMRETDAEDILDLSAELIDEILETDLMPPTLNVGRRREVARAVEALLWENPLIRGFPRLSLDDASVRLGCSRRSIQLALQEEFGMGFVTLKRLIRLQQVHAILRTGPEQASGIGRIAKAHEFNHLSRFAKHYRDMFGTLPSLDALALAE